MINIMCVALKGPSITSTEINRAVLFYLIFTKLLLQKNIVSMGNLDIRGVLYHLTVHEHRYLNLFLNLLIVGTKMDV